METVIDRSCDQTAEHTHLRGKLCSACGDVSRPPDACLPTQPLSPSILEYQIIGLKEGLDAAERRAVKAETERDVARIRVAQFERLTSILADKCDELVRMLDNFTNNEPPELKSAV